MGRNAGPPSCPVRAGNPIHVGTGNNYNRELDYLGSGAFPLRLDRHYNSILGVQSRRHGWRWKHTYEREVVLDGASVILLRHTGRALYFNQVGQDWIGAPDLPGRLERLVDGGGQPAGWLYVDADDSIEMYGKDGQLLSISTRTGFTQSLTYDESGRLIRVADPFGRALAFSYDSDGQLVTMTDPGGQVYSYAYNGNRNLAGVTYPDETPGDVNDNPTRQYHYEDPVHPDALTGITDENGAMFVTWAYDSKGRVTSNRRADGADSVTLTYDDSAGTSTLTDALGEVRTYSFETVHDHIRVSAVSGAPCASGCTNPFASYTYNSNGYPASHKDHNGNLTTFEIDARGLESNRTEAAGTPETRTIATQWHAVFRLPVLVTEPGKTTAFTYDAKGRLLSRIETDTASGRSRTVTNTHNALGLLATRDGPRTEVNDVTAFAYDSQGNLFETINALGHPIRVTAYDPHGRPLTWEDPNGLTTTLAYDARGRLLSREIGGQLTSFEYDGVGNITRTTLPDGSYLVSEYDEAQRLAAVEDNLGNRTEFTLDAAGNRVGETVRDPASTVTRTRLRVYNTLNRLIENVGGAGQRTVFEYDLQGNQTAVVDGNNARVTSDYDALNRLSKTIDPDLGETGFEYDARDNLVSVADAEGLVTTFSYDGLENLTVQSSPDTGLTQFAYDDAGNRITRTDARGVLARFGYDALDRLVSIEYPDAVKNVGFEYDLGTNGIGRLTRLTDESGSTSFVYDIRGNLLSETRTIDGVAYPTAYSYDSADRMQSITYASGTVITYTRDDLGRIGAASASTGGITQTLASDIAYLPFGRVERFDYGNGIPLTRVFDQDYRLTDQTASSVQDLSLGYDPANNITNLTDGLDGSRSQSFAYDGLNRLIHGQGVYGTEAYSYDGIGNRLSFSSSAGLDSYDYALGSHRLASITGPNVTSFGYDANGNTVVQGPLGFTFDDTNRMTQALASGVLLAGYTYNARGERVKKTGPGGGGSLSKDVLFTDDFSSPDGTVIDDQPGGAWLGKQPKSAISATVATGAARVAPGQAIRSSALFTDTGDATLSVRARLVQGTLLLKLPGKPRGLRVRFNGKRRVAVTSGAFDDETQRTKVVFRLPAASQHVGIELRLRAGTARVLVTDDQGGSQDTGDLDNAVLSADDRYRLKLRAITVAGVPAPGLFDDVQVSRSADSAPVDTTHFVYDKGGKLIGEYDAAGAPIAEYVYFESQPLAMLRGGAVYYYHTDQLGTPQAMTDQSQTIVWRADYTPFGDTIVAVNDVENPLRFPGQYFDQETGLHYNYFRDYDPSAGRYVESDPIGLNAGINTYSYTLGNPLKFSDPLGLDIWIGMQGSGSVMTFAVGLSGGAGKIRNLATDEQCDFSIVCGRGGFGVLGAISARALGTLFGPGCGKDLAGGSLQATGDLIFRAAGVGGSVGVSESGVTVSSGGLDFGLGFAASVDICSVKIISCKNSPTECLTCQK